MYIIILERDKELVITTDHHASDMLDFEVTLNMILISVTYLRFSSRYNRIRIADPNIIGIRL